MTLKAEPLKTKKKTYLENVDSRKALIKERNKLVFQVAQLNREIDEKEKEILSYKKQHGVIRLANYR